MIKGERKGWDKRRKKVRSRRRGPVLKKS